MFAAATTVVTVFVVMCIAGSYPVFEDAFISFRYAQQFAEGHGLVFNPGERVWGYSNFLWMVWLGGSTAMGVDTVLAARLSGMGLGIGVLLVLFRWVWKSHEQELAPALLVSLLLASNVHFVIAASNGMETMLFTLLTLVAVISFATCIESGSRIPNYAFWMFLAALTRSEGPLLMVTALGWEAWRFLRDRDRIHLQRGGLALLGFGVLWGGFELAMALYYGYPLPNSYYVKVAHSYASVADGAKYVFGFLLDRNPMANGHALFVSLIAACCLLDARRRARNQLLALFALSNFAFVVYVGGDFLVYCYRFIVPAVPLLLMLLVSGAIAIRDRLESSFERARPWPARLAFGLVAATLGVTNLTAARSPLIPYFHPGADRTTLLLDGLLESAQQPASIAERTVALFSTQNRSIPPSGMVGQVLERHLSPGDVIATCQCGQIPYHLADFRIVDMCGLMDDHVAHNGITVEHLFEQGVDHLILYQNRTRHLHSPNTLFPGLFGSTHFLSNFELAHVFCHETALPERGLAMKSRMLLFSRRETPKRPGKSGFRLEAAIQQRVAAGSVTLMQNQMGGPQRGQRFDIGGEPGRFCNYLTDIGRESCDPETCGPNRARYLDLPAHNPPTQRPTNNFSPQKFRYTASSRRFRNYQEP